MQQRYRLAVMREEGWDKNEIANSSNSEDEEAVKERQRFLDDEIIASLNKKARQAAENLSLLTTTRTAAKSPALGQPYGQTRLTWGGIFSENSVPRRDELLRKNNRTS
jgi:hypothetical protein